MKYEPVTTFLDINSLNIYIKSEYQTQKNVVLKLKKIFDFQSVRVAFMSIEENKLFNYLMTFTQ